MAECVQGPKEKESDYIVKMFDMRDHIKEVNALEEEPLGDTFVQKKMIRAPLQLNKLCEKHSIDNFKT